MTAQKTQIPIVAKLIMQNGITKLAMKFAFLSNSSSLEKGIVLLKKKYHFAYLISLAVLL